MGSTYAAIYLCQLPTTPIIIIVCDVIFTICFLPPILLVDAPIFWGLLSVFVEFVISGKHAWSSLIPSDSHEFSHFRCEDLMSDVIRQKRTRKILIVAHKAGDLRKMQV